MIADDFLDAMDVGERTGHWGRQLAAAEDGRRTFVAPDGNGEVAGWAIGGPNRLPALGTDGELQAIYVRPAVQRGGLGRALFRAIALDLAGRGFRSMVVLVLEGNGPARRFYEGLGGALLPGRVERKPFGLDVVEVAYAWPSLAALTAAVPPGGVTRS